MHQLLKLIKQRSVNVSIKAREIEEEKQAMAEFGLIR